MTKIECQKIEDRLVIELKAKKTTDNKALSENEINQFQLTTKDGLFWITSAIATDNKEINYYYFKINMKPIASPIAYNGHIVSRDCQSFDAIKRAIFDYPLGTV